MRHHEDMMGVRTAAEKTHWVVERARAEGFDLCGVAAVEQMEELARLPEWLASGYAGEMKYLHDERRSDPRKALAGARSVIVVALNYNTAHPRTHEARYADASKAPRGWISRYAWGDDYHDVLREKLEALIGAMRAEFDEPFEARAYVDTGPIVERIAAKYAGLGWLGKNTCLINQQKGSWLFLGTILTTLELAPAIGAATSAGFAEAPARDLCGSCTRCLDACPTDAFPAPYVLDARRCISYLTIELRGAIPEEFRAAMGSAVIGCDICQDVCPWNRKAPVSALAAFQPRTFGAATAEEKSETDRQSLFAPELEWLASLTQEEFSRIFRKSAAKRAKWRGLVRNACVALGNARLAEDPEVRARVLRLLARLADSEDTLISEHARWAMERLR